MKSISDLVGQSKVAGRLHDTLMFKGIEQAAERYESVINKLGAVDMGKLAAADKQAIYKRIESANESVTREMQQLSNKLLSNLAAAQDKFETNSRPSHTDYQLAALMAGKSTQELLSIAFNSKAAAKLLYGTDAGVIAGLSPDQIKGLAKYAAPAEFAEIEAVEKSLNTVIKFKDVLDKAHFAHTANFAASGNDKKVLSILDDETAEESEEPTE